MPVWGASSVRPPVAGGTEPLGDRSCIGRWLDVRVEVGAEALGIEGWGPSEEGDGGCSDNEARMVR